MAINDSGDRRVFFLPDGTEAGVRDMGANKGRCDLLPLDVCSEICGDDAILSAMDEFQKTGNHRILELAMLVWMGKEYSGQGGAYGGLLDVAHHYEDGLTKYPERSWEKGIPCSVMVDSAVRHYLKMKSGWTDENHRRAFVWNVLGCIWMAKHRPELNSYCDKNEEKN